MLRPFPAFAARTWTTGPTGLRALLEAPADENGGTAGGAPAPAPAKNEQKQAPAPSSGNGGGGDELAAMKAKLAEYEGQISARAKADEEAAAKAKAKAAEDGNHKAVIEATQRELDAAKAKLAELDGFAKLGKGYHERESARVEAAKKDLTESQQRLIDSQSSIDLKAQLLDEFIGQKGQPRGKAPSPGGTPSAPVDFSTITDPVALRRARDDHPKEWEAFKTSLRGEETRQPTLMERQKKPPTATA